MTTSHQFSRFTTCVAMVFERLLPLVLPAFAILALFLTALWFGLFRFLPLPLHYGVLGLFGLLLLGALSPLRHFHWPKAQEVTARLEAHNALQHAPIRTQADTIATSNSPLEQALWIEHQKRMAAKIGVLEGGNPNAGIAPKRRYIAFACLTGLTAIAFAFSKAPHGGALADILAEPPAIATTQPRLDLWLTPPNYTGKAPIFVQAGAETDVLSVPQGSIATLRVSRAENTPPEALDRIAFSFSKGTDAATAIEKAKPGLYEWTMTDSGILKVESGDETLRSIAVNVIEDAAPSIAWNGAIVVNRNGSFELKYTTEDDYGVREGWGQLRFQDTNEDANPLYDLPEITLRLRGAKGQNDGQSRIALGDHPLAGLPMALQLHVKDAASQEGQSESRDFILPQRRFTNPVALALVEQRGLIARNSYDAVRVLRLMEAMMLHPEIVIDNSSAFLGIRTAYQRIRNAQNDDDLRDIVDYLWEIALNIEEGQLSDAEKRLREARDNLRDAIENGADEQELAQRIQELRDALNEYLQELARQSQQNNQQQAQQQQNSQQIEAQDLQDMLDKIEELAQQGAKEQAEQLLSQMEQLLDNLQAGQHQQEQGDNQQSQMQQRMNELGDIMRQQQQLMDETFQQQRPQDGQDGQEQQQGQGQQDPNQPGQNQQGQNQQGQNSQGRNGEGQQPSNQGMQRLQQGQQGLQQRLRDFTQSLEGMGINPGEQFGEAQGSMGEAGESLGQGDAGSATGQQADALQALRDGASDMMQQMQQAMEGERGGQNPQQAQQSERQGGNDPLGRPQQSNNPQFDSDVYVPDEIDMQRAREILNAIRKRLGDEAAPNSEKDYLERLLEFD